MRSRSNPFEQMERFFDRMSRQFEEATEGWDMEPFEGLTVGAGPMAADVVEQDEEYVVTVDLPGFEREDVDLSVTDDTLHVTARREEAEDEEDETYIRKERRHRTVDRRLSLPAPIDRESVSATMKNGVLTVTLPKAETSEAHQIEIS